MSCLPEKRAIRPHLGETPQTIMTFQISQEFSLSAPYLENCIQYCIQNCVQRQSFPNYPCLSDAASFSATKVRSSGGHSSLTLALFGIFLADDGSQYAAKDYPDKLDAYGLVGSMPRRGNLNDDAKVENFKKTLKVEEVYLMDYETFDNVASSLPCFIEKTFGFLSDATKQIAETKLRSGRSASWARTSPWFCPGC